MRRENGASTTDRETPRRSAKSITPQVASVQPVVPTSVDRPAPKPGLDVNSGRYTIQIAAYRNLENARRGREILNKSLPRPFPALEIFER